MKYKFKNSAFTVNKNSANSRTHKGFGVCSKIGFIILFFVTFYFCNSEGKYNRSILSADIGALLQKILFFHSIILLSLLYIILRVLF